MAVDDELARRGDGGGEAEAKDDVVESAFQEAQEGVARGAASGGGALDVVAELSLGEAVVEAEFLFLDEALGELAESQACRGAVLSGRIGPSLCRLAGEAG